MRRTIDMLQREDGFTLIELMVVTSILAVLLVMATSTFTGLKSRAQDTAAKETAATAIEIGRVVFTDNATYATVTPAALATAEPNISFVDGFTQSDASGIASTNVPDAATTGHTLVAAVWSDSGKCYFVRDWVTSGISYAVIPNATTADCVATNTGALTFASAWPTS